MNNLCTLVCIISTLVVSKVGGQTEDTPTAPPPPPTFDSSSSPTTTSNTSIAVVRVQEVEVPASVTHHQLIMVDTEGQERVIYEGKIRRGANYYWQVKTFDNGYLLLQETSKLDLTFHNRFMVYVGTNWSFSCIREVDE